MGVAGPDTGSYTLRFDGTVVAATDYYPSDGRGGKTTTATDSFARDADETLITFVTGGTQTSGVEISIHDQDGNKVWGLTQGTSGQGQWGEVYGEYGPLVLGNWSVQTTGTAPEITVGFRILSSR